MRNKICSFLPLPLNTYAKEVNCINVFKHRLYKFQNILYCHVFGLRITLFQQKARLEIDELQHFHRFIKYANTVLNTLFGWNIYIFCWKFIKSKHTKKII